MNVIFSNSFHRIPCNVSAPFPPLIPHSFSPPSAPCLYHHCLDRLHAGTRCAAAHLSMNCLHPIISSSSMHHCFSQSFHLIKYIHLPSIYFWHATALSMNSSKDSDCSCDPMLGVWIARALCISCWRSWSSCVDYHFSSPYDLLQLALPVDTSPISGLFLSHGRALATEFPGWSHQTTLSWFHVWEINHQLGSFQSRDWHCGWSNIHPTSW